MNMVEKPTFKRDRFQPSPYLICAVARRCMHLMTAGALQTNIRAVLGSGGVTDEQICHDYIDAEIVRKVKR
jgi:hypothetical protein